MAQGVSGGHTFVVVLIVVGLGVVAVEDVGSDIGSMVREDHCCLVRVNVD